MTRPLLENPAYIQPVAEGGENPVFVPLGPAAYNRVFEHAIDVTDDYFEIAYYNRYSGLIETHPSVAPGIGQPWRGGSPDMYQRVLATFQTIRHRAVVEVQTARDDGFFVDVKVYKELEDIPSPLHLSAGGATYRSEATVDRQSEVIEEGQFDVNWIPIGRDHHLEQVIMSRIADLRGIACP
jgi:hypothetical protein